MQLSFPASLKALTDVAPQVARDTSGPECIDGYAKTADWDIGGYDLENHEVDYTSVDDFVSCAGFCTAREDCQAFNFGHPGNGRCCESARRELRAAAWC